MINISFPNPNKWSVSYDEYTDVLQLYKDSVLFTPKNEYNVIKINSDIIYEDKKTSNTILVELKKAYSKVGDIDNKTKKAIMEDVKGYLIHHGR